jgi:pantetheine-phosphate adenylyltransferase
MKKVIFPGTFDPPTLGHLDIARRAAEIFDHVYIAVGSNIRKKKTAFSVEERIDLLRAMTSQLSNIEVVTFNGLLVDFAKQLHVHAILRSIRNVSDFDYENLQAQMNRQLGDVETLYMVADEKYRLISSTLIREIASYGKRLHAFVPKEVEEVIFNRLSQTQI